MAPTTAAGMVERTRNVDNDGRIGP